MSWWGCVAAVVGAQGAGAVAAVDILEHADDEVDGGAAVEAHALGAAEGNGGVFAHEELDEHVDVVVAGVEDGNVAPAVAGVVLAQDVGGHGVHGCLVGAAVGVGLRYGVEAAHLHVGPEAVEAREERLAHVLVAFDAELVGEAGEEGVVEAHDAVGAAVVGVVGGVGAPHDVAGGEVVDGHAVVEQAAVGVAEAVDGLLLVADDEAVGAGVEAVGHEGA